MMPSSKRGITICSKQLDCEHYRGLVSRLVLTRFLCSIVGGMYINISLHDYIRGITNVHHSNSTWTLDPRIEIAGTESTPPVQRGVGNMVSAEFNLLYRFHAATSQRDDKWTGDFFRSIFGDKDPQEIGLKEFYEGVAKYEGIPKEPSERCFAGLSRDPKTGTFKDSELVKILKESIEDPAGTSLP